MKSNSIYIVIFIFLGCIVWFLQFDSPLQLSPDTSLQLLSVQQWHDGVSPYPNYLYYPDKTNIINSDFKWILWYPPGLPFVISLFVFLGIEMVVAVKLFVISCSLSGGLGWLYIGDKLLKDKLAKIMLFIITCYYCFVSLNIINFGTAKIYVFGAMPWIIISLYRVIKIPLKKSIANIHTILKCIGIGLFSALPIWFSYQSIYYISTILALACIYLYIKNRDFIVFTKVTLPMFVGYSVGVLGLLFLNYSITGFTNPSELFDQNNFSKLEYSQLVLNFLTAPGSAIGINTSTWNGFLINLHLIWSKYVPFIDIQTAALLSRINGVLMSFLFFFSLYMCKKRINKIFPLFTAIVFIIFTVLLLYSSLKYNFDALRKLGYYAPIALVGTLAYAIVFVEKNNPMKLKSWRYFAFIFVLFPAVINTSFYIRHHIQGRNIALPKFEASEKNLFTYRLTSTNVKNLKAKLDKQINFSKDITVFLSRNVESLYQIPIELGGKSIALHNTYDFSGYGKLASIRNFNLESSLKIYFIIDKNDYPQIFNLYIKPIHTEKKWKLLPIDQSDRVIVGYYE